MHKVLVTDKTLDFVLIVSVNLDTIGFVQVAFLVFASLATTCPEGN